MFPWDAAAGQGANQVAVARPPSASGPGVPAVTQPLSQYIAASPRAVLPDEIRELGKRHILDTLASMVACRDLQPAVLARRYAAAMSGGGPSTILATSERAALIDAVFASAVTGHSAEINDFSPSAYTQPGPAVVSTALCLGAARHSSGASLLNAVVTGYELTCRIPKTLDIGNLRDRLGLANHGVGPVFGSAAAAASILEMPEPRIPHTQLLRAAGLRIVAVAARRRSHREAFVFAGMPARNGLRRRSWSMPVSPAYRTASTCRAAG